MNGWQRTLMNQQVGSAGLGVGGSGGMQDVVALAAAADPQFVRLRDMAREKIFKFLESLPLLPPWRPRLRALATRLEEILFRKYPTKMEYYKMTRRPMPQAMVFAVKTYTAQNRQYRQIQQSLRQIASSPGYGAMIPTSSIMQGASENSRMSYVTGNVGPLTSSADMVLQNANMDTSLPEGAFDGHVNTMLSLGTNPTPHDLSRASNNNMVTPRLDTSLSEANRFSPKVTQAHPTPIKNLPREPKFTCPVCISELVDASSTICGHIFCKKCIEASIQFQKKCPTCRTRLTMGNFHRIYLPTMD
ncbi:probable histone acetyltransferase HAC-like 1 [Triticum dicoccoides]|uniref:probable histone acetyltransferase HAC-like 1 n=1 Tax=Triticum dicoccoides TaxID=85692 RepID=UPI00188ECC57|nr:probable histone acetyltransferase HAC-like 1 [Triticum dicoccoides]